jgi:hypothetical protein
LENNRDQKRLQKNHVKVLKKHGCFYGEVAIQETRLWRKLLKVGNRLRKRLKEAKEYATQRRANAKFRADPHLFAKNLFDPPEKNGNTLPTKERCEQYFPNLYKDEKRSHQYKPMRDMKRPVRPVHDLNLAPPTRNEFRRAVYSKRNAASPGRNGVNYVVYKRLPAAFELLYQIICKAWNGDVPDSWAQAQVILLFKDEDPSDPANYRPIALQSCSGKIYFTIWAKRLEKYMTLNGYFVRSKQKGFLQGIAGCSEHIAALKAALRDAKASHRQIVVAWIDLKNAFGSVSHNLIQFALNWYHVPAHLANIIHIYYDMLFATIETREWSSKCFTYEIGVFQGCVISPLLFNMVFNLLLDLLSPRTDEAGYELKKTNVVIHDLAYADDLSIVARSPQEAQTSLNLMDRFLSWTRTMAAKPRKCKSLAFKYWCDADERAGRTRLLKHRYTPYDPELTVAGQNIGFIAEEPFKFLGWKVYHHLGESDQKKAVRDCFEKHMDLVDKSNVHGFMKLWLYQHYVVAYLAWPFMVYDFDVSYVLKLERIANRYLKCWAGLYKRSITSILYRTRENFGLQLCKLEVFYKRLRVGQAYLLKHSPDIKLNRIYTVMLVQQGAFKRVWQPAPVLEQMESKVEHKRHFAGQSDQAGLGSVPDRYIRKFSPTEHKHRVLQTLSSSLFDSLAVADMDKAMQGCFLRFKDARPFDLSWRHLIGTRNPKLVTWVLNASINSVVTPDLRKLWGVCHDAKCPLCGHSQASLFHILVGCSVALKQLRYSWRHDSVLLTLQDPLQRRIEDHNASPPKPVDQKIKFRSAKNPPPKRRVVRVKNSSSSILGTASDWKLRIDFTKEPIPFPVHICVTEKRPDIVLYSDSHKTVILIELTCPAEENIADARLRKEIKYTPLKDQIVENDWQCHLYTIEVGARGFVSGSVPRLLRRLGFTNSNIRDLVRRISISASRCSFAIFKSYKVRKWRWVPPVKIG